MTGGTPDAMAIPMHSGKATRNTTTEARASVKKVFRSMILNPRQFEYAKLIPS